jgi:hypothetical protein
MGKYTKILGEVLTESEEQLAKKAEDTLAAQLAKRQADPEKTLPFNSGKRLADTLNTPKSTELQVEKLIKLDSDVARSVLMGTGGIGAIAGGYNIAKKIDERSEPMAPKPIIDEDRKKEEVKSSVEAQPTVAGSDLLKDKSVSQYDGMNRVGSAIPPTMQRSSLASRSPGKAAAAADLGLDPNKMNDEQKLLQDRLDETANLYPNNWNAVRYLTELKNDGKKALVEFKDRKQLLGWLEIVEKLGQSMIQWGAATSGGSRADMSNLRFDKTDWDKKMALAFDEYREANSQLQKSVEGVQENEKLRSNLMESMAKMSSAKKEAEAKRQQEEKLAREANANRFVISRNEINARRSDASADRAYQERRDQERLQLEREKLQERGDNSESKEDGRGIDYGNRQAMKQIEAVNQALNDEDKAGNAQKLGKYEDSWGSTPTINDVPLDIYSALLRTGMEIGIGKGAELEDYPGYYVRRNSDGSLSVHKKGN